MLFTGRKQGAQTRSIGSAEALSGGRVVNGSFEFHVMWSNLANRTLHTSAG